MGEMGAFVLTESTAPISDGRCLATIMRAMGFLVDRQVVALQRDRVFGHYGVLTEYVRYYNENRTHLGLEKDCPEPRLIEHPDSGPIKSEPMVRGLHHRYYRQAA
jgi:hypothetical protein